jgi:malate/lactate dehydrogenase
MKAGIVGLGAVGRAVSLAAVQRGSASELILVTGTRKSAKRSRSICGMGCR